MTDLKKIADAVKNSKIKLTKEFWDKQNEKIRDNQKKFAKEYRDMLISPEEFSRFFDV